MKNLLYILIFLAVAGLNAQTLRIERTDVDSTRSGHITANYTFGIDIYIDELDNVNSASFQLRWNQSQYIFFSGYKIGEFDDQGTVFITDETPIPNTDEKFVNVGVFSGSTIGENDFDSPMILHLEFTATHDSPDRETVTFNFQNFFATAFVDGSQTNLEITAEPLTLNIHGFINVWPGDSNNDGLVDTRDYNQIGLYFEGNSINSSYRSFKRDNSTIMWIGQRVLVWDNADATFADCDGDGVITVADGLVVFHNDNKTHPEGTGLLGDQEEAGLKTNIPDDAHLVPVYAGYNGDYKAASLKINIENKENYLGIVSGKLFDKTNAHIISDLNGNSLEFTIGSFEKDFKINKSGIVAYVAYDKIISKDKYFPTDGTVLLENGNFDGVATVTNVTNTIEEKLITVSEDDDNYYINSINEFNGYSVYDITGRKIKENFKTSTYLEINKNIRTGIYFLILNFESPKTIKLNITN